MPRSRGGTRSSDEEFPNECHWIGHQTLSAGEALGVELIIDVICEDICVSL